MCQIIYADKVKVAMYQANYPASIIGPQAILVGHRFNIGMSPYLVDREFIWWQKKKFSPISNNMRISLSKFKNAL